MNDLNETLLGDIGKLTTSNRTYNKIRENIAARMYVLVQKTFEEGIQQAESNDRFPSKKSAEQLSSQLYDRMIRSSISAALEIFVQKVNEISPDQANILAQKQLSVTYEVGKQTHQNQEILNHTLRSKRELKNLIKVLNKEQRCEANQEDNSELEEAFGIINRAMAHSCFITELQKCLSRNSVKKSEEVVFDTLNRFLSLEKTTSEETIHWIWLILLTSHAVYYYYDHNYSSSEVRTFDYAIDAFSKPFLRSKRRGQILPGTKIVVVFDEDDWSYVIATIYDEEKGSSVEDKMWIKLN